MDRDQIQLLLDDVLRDIEDRRSRIAYHEGQVAELGRDLEGLDRVWSYLSDKSNLASTKPMVDSSTPEPVRDRESIQGDASGGLGSLTQSGAAAVVLQQAGRALKIGEIIDEMIAGGFPLRVKRAVLYNSLYTSMKKSKGRFVRVGEGRWTVPNQTVVPEVIKNPKVIEKRPSVGQEQETGDDEHKTLMSYAEAAVVVAGESGGVIRSHDVADWMISKGLKSIDKRKCVSSTIYNCLDRSPRFEKLGGGQFRMVNTTPVH